MKIAKEGYEYVIRSKGRVWRAENYDYDESGVLTTEEDGAWTFFPFAALDSLAYRRKKDYNAPPED